jgi:hypothetical protein
MLIRTVRWLAQTVLLHRETVWLGRLSSQGIPSVGVWNSSAPGGGEWNSWEAYGVISASVEPRLADFCLLRLLGNLGTEVEAASGDGDVPLGFRRDGVHAQQFT